MKPSNHPGHIIPQDTEPVEGMDEMLTALPFTADEVSELLYGDDRATRERIDRLAELADHLRQREPGDVFDHDAASLLREFERAINALEAKLRSPGEPGALVEDPLDHRETLAPDSDELEAIDEEDEKSIEEDFGRPDGKAAPSAGEADDGR